MQFKIAEAIILLVPALIFAYPCLAQGTQSHSLQHRQGRASPAAVPPTEPQPSLPEIVDRLTAVQFQNHQVAHPYTVVRQYELLNRKSSEPSTVMAEVSVVPPGVKEYAIRSTQGGGPGERLVRRVLDHEVEIAPAWKQTALIEENYSFQLLGRENVDGHDCFVLGLSPRRDSKDLIRGRAWVDDASFNVLRIEGSPAKNPSWWVKHLDVTLQFSQVMGIWLQTALSARAEIRFFGEHIFRGRDVEMHTADGHSPVPPVLASRWSAHAGAPQQTSPPQARRSPPIVGAGVISVR